MVYSSNLAGVVAQAQSTSGDAFGRLAGIGATKGKSMNHAQIEQTAKDFESMFVSQMLEQMFGDSIGTELFGDEDTSEVYKSMMMEQYGKQIASSGGIGIADYVKRELIRLQEV
jgi:flagellar protein FlgJ